MALLAPDGHVVSAEAKGFEVSHYAREIRDWYGVTDIVLSFDMAIGLHRNGAIVTSRFFCGNEELLHPLAAYDGIAILQRMNPLRAWRAAARNSRGRRR